MRRYVTFQRPNGKAVIVNADTIFAVERDDRDPVQATKLTLDSGFYTVKGKSEDVALLLWGRDVRRPTVEVLAQDATKAVLDGIPNKSIRLLAMLASTTDKKGFSFRIADSAAVPIGGTHILPIDSMRTGLPYNVDGWCQTSHGKGLQIINPAGIPISLLLTLEIV